MTNLNSPINAKKNEEVESSKPKKKIIIWIGIGILILLITCLCIGVLFAASNKSENENDATRTSIIPTKSPTPIIIINENLEFIDGFSISIESITRELSETKDEQIVRISYSVKSKNVSWLGLYFEAEEWIIDANSDRHSARSVTDDCHIYDDEECSAIITFNLAIDLEKASLFYVKDKIFTNLEPVEVDDPNDRRFVAEINLDLISLSPTNTPEPTKTVTPSPTLTSTSLYTLTVTSSPKIMPSPTTTNTSEPSHIPGLNPEEILDKFSSKYNLNCLGWSYFWNVWSDECITTGWTDPSYGFAVFSRNKNTVDYIEASVSQINNPTLIKITSYFEEVLELPYSGSSPEIVIKWINSEIPNMDGTPGDIRRFTHSGINYRLYGNIEFMWLEIGEIEQYIEAP
jgi:hypothetical protein